VDPLEQPACGAALPILSIMLDDEYLVTPMALSDDEDSTVPERTVGCALRDILERRARARSERSLLQTWCIRMRKDLEQCQPQRGVRIQLLHDLSSVLVWIAPLGKLGGGKVLWDSTLACSAEGFYSGAVTACGDREYAFIVTVTTEYPFEA
jgi:hypothetical protein